MSAGLEAHCSGALWLSATRTAIVADAHLGYGWAQRRRGELGPLVDFRTGEKLIAFAEELQPARIVFLGDLVHAPRPCVPEREWIESALLALASRAVLVSVRGNHDRAFARDFGHLPLEFREFWESESLTAIHGDRLGAAPLSVDRTLVVGHLHPCLGLRDAAGASQKVPCFLASPSCVVLPAFSPFARGYEIGCGLPAALEKCFRGEIPDAFVTTGSRVVRLGSLRRAIEKMAELNVSDAASFRKRVGAR